MNFYLQYLMKTAPLTWVLVIIVFFNTCSTIYAQPPQPNAQAVPPVATSTVARGDQFPPPPMGFQRGNATMSGGRYVGNYVSMFRLILMMGLFVGWVWTSKWSYDDSHDLKVRPILWTSIILVTGFLSLSLAMATGHFGLTLLLGLLGCGVPLGIYIKERNENVPESGKVMTPKHLKKLAIKALAKIGIRIGTKETIDKAIGPPITFIGKSSTTHDRGADRSKQVETSKGYLAAKELVYDAILRRATDIHLEPKEDELSIRVRIDGVMYPTEPFDRATGDAVINIFKVLSAMDITEKRRPQDGSFRAEMEMREIDFRSATQGTRFGEYP